jgi:hypothetical protein
MKRKKKVKWFLSYCEETKVIYQPTDIMIRFMIGLKSKETKDVIFYYESKHVGIVKWLLLLSRKRKPRLGS